MPMPVIGRTAPRWATVAGVVALLAALLVQMFLLAHANSATWDEPDHAYSAYMQTKYGDFGLNPEHPPLVKYLAALPLLNLHLREPVLDAARPFRMQEVIGGREFVFGNDANAILLRARMATSVLTLLLGLIAFLMAREMFGTTAGMVTLGLLAFDPTLLANSALVTTDAGQACFMLWAVYAFYRFGKAPTPWRVVVLGLVLGLALATKHSTVLLFPMLVLLALAEIWRGRRGKQARRLTARYISALIASGVLAVVVLWAFYGFRYAARGASQALNPPLAVELQAVPSRIQAACLALVARAHLLPDSYLFGFAHVLSQAKLFPSFLLGHIYPHAVWFYFPPTMLIKSTLTFLILLGVLVWMLMSGRVRARREMLYLLLPAGLYLALAMAGGSNIGVRYVLPVYIFLAVAIGGACRALMLRDRRWTYVVVVLLAFQAISVARSFPAYVAYANEAVGGPANVHNLLSDSSVDWGQQLKSVKRYLDENHIHECWFAYFGDGVAEPSFYGIPCKPLITADSLYFGVPHEVPPAIHGPVLMSAGVLSGFEFGPAPLNPYEQFKSLKPVAAIDYGVFVFDGTFSIPLAAALSHVQKAEVLLGAKQAPEALAEAEEAAALAPESARVLANLAQALEANGRAAEAKTCRQKALRLAQTVQPAFQKALAAQLQSALERYQ